jgi:signal transduction histidine kinase/ActR/RegA family two-component response regulator
MQAEELAQQNEEIKVQAEELAQQNEEIEAQTEELAGQNEELQGANERLGVREEILQNLLASTREPGSGLAVLRATCQRALHAVGKPADCIAILRRDSDMFRLKTQASSAEGVEAPDEWPLEGSIASVVLAQDKTAYLSDLAKQPELAAPFGSGHRVRSILATPLHVAGESYGVAVALSAHAGHWTQDQFRIFEWVAAQCGLITEGIRWQRALIERTQEVESANQAKDKFLAMLSHELRTPLTPVLAAAGVLEHDERIPHDVREDLRMIRRNVAIQSRLVDDLLDLTRLGRGKIDLDTQNLDLAALLQEAATIVSPDLDAKEQVLELHLAAAEGCHVQGDGARLQQVFWNLLKNAIKFSPGRGTIRVKAQVKRGASPRVAVAVSDDGIGIDAVNLDRIFKPFEQVAATGKQRGGDGGLGLGLAIAKAVVELHHGELLVASEGRGRGATFTVELPLMVASKLAPATSATRSPLPTATAASGLRILLVEDHGDTGRVIARLLRNAGYAVEHAETAGAALELFTRSEFDLVISDLGLPDESGLALMQKLRALRPGLIGICLSGYGMEDDLQACREAGFAEHLTKPVDMQRLRAAIGRVAHRVTT